jgi:hypothetical protein
MLKAIKIRIYPNTEQKIYIAKLLGSCRFIYNNCLAFKIDKYNNDKLNVGLKDLSKHLTELKTKKNMCGNNHDRDYNTAKNIENERKRFLSIKDYKIGLNSPEFTLGEYPLMDDKAVIPLKNYDRKIQERKELLWNTI